MVDEQKLLARITVDSDIFGGKPIIRGRRLAVEHVLSMLAAGDTAETILEGYPGSSPKTSRLASSTQGRSANATPPMIRISGAVAKADNSWSSVLVNEWDEWFQAPLGAPPPQRLRLRR